MAWLPCNIGGSGGSSDMPSGYEAYFSGLTFTHFSTYGEPNFNVQNINNQSWKITNAKVGDYFMVFIGRVARATTLSIVGADIMYARSEEDSIHDICIKATSTEITFNATGTENNRFKVVN